MDRRRFLPTYHYDNNTDGVLQNSVGRPLRDYKIYGNSEQNGTPTPEAPVVIESVGDEMDNLFDYSKIASKTIEGITYTNNNDGSFTANGTLTFTLAILYLSPGIDKNAFVIGETYYLDCGAELNTDTRRYYLFLQINNSATGKVRYFSSNGNIKTFVLAENEYINTFEFRIHSPTGEFYTVENVVFKPVLRKVGYKVPIKVIGKNILNEPYKDLGTTNIYLDEPLRKAGDIADYVDFKNGKVVRALDCLTFDGTENWRATAEIVYMEFPKTASGDYVYDFCSNSISTHLKNNADIKADGELYFVPVSSVLRVYKKNGTYTDVEGWKTFLAEEYTKGNPVQLITPFKTPTEEAIELPPIPTAKGIVNIMVDTDVQPSGAVWQYYRE